MTASAQIVGTVGTIPDAVSLSSPDIEVSAHTNFRNLLEQYRSTRESTSETDNTRSATPQKDKEKDSASAVAAQISLTQMVEPPRVILPLTASVTLRSNGTASEDSAAAPQDSTAPAETDSQYSPIAGTLRTLPDIASVSFPDSRIFAYANFPNAVRLHHSSQQHAAEPAVSMDSGDQRTQSISDPTQAGAAPLSATRTLESPSLQPPTTPNTLRQDPGLPVKTDPDYSQVAGTTRAIPKISDASISLDPKVRNVVHQYHPSGERDSEAASTKSGDPTYSAADATGGIAVPLPVIQTVEPPRPNHPLAAAIAPDQGATTPQSSALAPQNFSLAPVTDPRPVASPGLQGADDTTAAPNLGSLAFAARLSPNDENTQPPASGSIHTAGPQPRPQTPPQFAPPVMAKQVATGADLPSDPHGGEGGAQSQKENMSDRFAKPETLLPQIHTAIAGPTVAPANNHVSNSPLSPMAHVDQVDPPAVMPSSNRDITIRIPGSTDQGTAVRFVERAGEVHVSVRTDDAEMAQNLRGGLNDLVNRLEDGGIRTEVWRPGSDASSSQSDSHHPFTDPDGSQGHQNSGSHNEQESRQQNKPRLVEQLDGSIGNPTFKETTHLVWQA